MQCSSLRCCRPSSPFPFLLSFRALLSSSRVDVVLHGARHGATSRDSPDHAHTRCHNHLLSSSMFLSTRMGRELNSAHLSTSADCTVWCKGNIAPYSKLVASCTSNGSRPCESRTLLYLVLGGCLRTRSRTNEYTKHLEVPNVNSNQTLRRTMGANVFQTSMRSASDKSFAQQKV